MKPATTLALVALATSLGGCKSFIQAFDFSKHSSSPQYAVGQADLDEGRAHLSAGNPGNALGPLHRAALNPVTSGEALNALGVAYAKLGRGDLAERYFIAATRTNMNNARYVANLNRFYQSELGQSSRVLHAQKQRADEAYARFAQSELAVDAEAPELDQRMVVSGGETRTLTLSRPATSTRVTASKPASAMSASADTPAARSRISINGTPLENQQSGSARTGEVRLSTQPARGAVTRVRVGAVSERATYPLRVRLAPRARSGSAN